MFVGYNMVYKMRLVVFAFKAIKNKGKDIEVRLNDEKRRLIPTKLGKALIEALEAVEPDIVLPKNRATIEAFVSDLANGKKTYEEVLNYSLKFYKEKYINLTEKIDELYNAFGNHFELVEDY